jgi:hypothetical protein
VNAHPDADDVAFRPPVAREGALGLNRSTEPSCRRRKRRKEGVALGLDLHAVPSGDRLPENLVVSGQEIRVCLAHPLKQSGRALDVRE